MASKEYEMAVKIAGKIENSFYETTKLTKKQLREIAKEARNAEATRAQLFSQGLKDAAPTFNAIENAGKAAFKAVAAAATTAATAVTAVTAASVSVGSSFEAQMSTVQAISGASRKDFEKLNDLAKELGASTQFTATEAGQAMEYMAMAGWKTEDMLQGMQGVLNLAASSGEDLATTSDIVTDAMTALGMKADEVEHFADVLAAAATNSNTNVSMMGETFQYAASLAGAMNYSIEDVAIAIGLMANSGIKASDAGTALRKIFAETTEGAQVSGKELGNYTIKTQNADGSMRDLKSVIEDLRMAFSKMTEAEKVANAEAIAGKTAMSGLLAIVNASETDYEKLEGAIYNCTGAAEKMADIRLDNLKGDLTIAQSAAEGLGIQIYEGINEPMRAVVQSATELIGEIGENLADSGFLEDITKKVPTVKREIKELGESISDFSKPFLAVGGWLLDNPGLIEGTIVGIGSSLAVYKVASGIMSMASALGALGPVGIGILAIGGVVGVIVGIGKAAKKSAEDAKKANLAEHFGNISLSLKDLNEAAEFIIYTDNLGKVREALEQFEGLDDLQKSINDSVSAINKANWKVSIGMELSADEKEDYRSNIESYVQQCQQYAADQQYAMTMAVGVLTENDLEGQNIVNQLNDFYADKQEELAKLGTDLNNAITDAFQDGLLDIDEAARISEIQAQMAEIQSQLAGGDFEANMEVLSAKYGGKIDAESFQSLQAELAEDVEEAKGAYEEAYKSSVSSELARLQDGDITQKEYDEQMQVLKSDYLDKLKDIDMKSINFQLDTIMNQYSDQLAEAEPEIQKMIENMLASSEEDGTGHEWILLRDMIEGSGVVAKDTQNALGELYKEMEPSLQMLNETANEYMEMYGEVPKEIMEAKNNAALIGMLGGNSDSTYKYLGGELENNEVYQQYKETAIKHYETMPEEVKDAIKENQSVMQEEINNFYKETDETIKAQFQNGFDIETDIRIKMNPKYGISDFRATMPVSPIGLNVNMGHADGGIFTKPHITWFAEKTPEAAIPIDGSRNAINLWQQTGELLGMSYSTSGDGLSALSKEIYSSQYTTDNSANIEFKPELNFYGEAPKKEDITLAFNESFEEFKKMMDRYVKERGRLAFKLK